MPRSGHHLFEMVLRNTLKEEFGYCEFYETGCCKAFPCNADHHSAARSKALFLQKSHDFDFTDPRIVPGTFRIVQYRSPIPRSLSNYELHLRGGAPDTIRAFRHFLVKEALYFCRFYEKWISDRSSEFFLLSYEQLTGDPVSSLLAFFRHIGMPIDLARVAEGVAKSIGRRGRDNSPFKPADVYSHRYAKAPVLANFEDIVIRNCPGYYPVKYFAPTDSNASLLGLIFNARNAIEQRNYDEGLSFASRAYAQDPDDPTLLSLCKSARVSAGPLPTKAGQPATSSSTIIPRRDIEVVMLTYNEIDMLRYSIPPLSKYFDHFLILDMESTDGTCAFIKEQLGDRARVISYKRELLLEFGYAHARNFAAANSEKQWVFMVDADEVLVDGVTLAGVSADLPVSETMTVTLERRNLQNDGWKLGEPFDPARFTGRIVKKDRLYRPSAKIYWEGYIHEELVKRPQPDAPRAGSFMRLDHLSSFRSPTREI
jgi:hypothetical protein